MFQSPYEAGQGKRDPLMDIKFVDETVFQSPYEAGQGKRRRDKVL